MSNRFLKGSLLSTTVIAGLAFASPAAAQDPAVAASAKDQTPATQECAPGQVNCAENPADVPAVGRDDSEAIVVTGSRIASPNITSLAPVQVIGETDIDQSGAINVQEILSENPVFGTPGLTRTNSAFLTSGAGVATANLRNLGSNRTLILVNGRRVVAGLAGSATVDLNVIPTQFVERIDILTGGASSLYGSDAIAGVVNFLYKRNFSGILAEGQYGISERGDSARYQVSLTGGGNFADDRGNLMVHLSYTNEQGLLSRDRKNTRTDDISEITYSYDPNDFTVEHIPFLSSFVPQGRFTVGDSRLDRAGNQPFTFTYSPTGVLQPCFTANTATCSVTARGPLDPLVPNLDPVTGLPRGPITFSGSGVGPNGFNRQQYRTLAVPVERYLFATRGNFEITPSINAIVEATYAKTTSSREIEPFPLDSVNIFPVNGRAPIQTFVGGVAVTNPFVPAAILSRATDTDGDGLLDIGFARRLAEFGTRNSASTRDFYRVVAGLEGKLLDGRFSWDLTYNYGQTSEAQTSNGQVNVASFANALQGIPDLADVDNDGLTTTDVICASATARAQGCQPINLFGFDSISPAAVAYIAAEQTFQTRITQQVWAANISGTAVELPAGPLGIALGAEYRKESSSANNDALTNAGLNAGNALPDTAGRFSVKEFYGEINVPVLKDLPFVQALNLRAAGRISDYSTVGLVKTYSLGADWTPIDAIRIRGTYAKAVRAPNIGELFTAPSQTFPPGLVDPCTGIGATGGGALGDNCRAAPGVLANIAANGVFTLVQADKQGISGFNAGNPGLDAESSRSITVGAVINPRSIPALRNLVLSVDYYNILVTDVIAAPPRAFTLDRCYQQGDPLFCSLITRRTVSAGSASVGSIQFINATGINGGELKSEGIDFVATYRTSLDRFVNGVNMNARLAYTHLLDGYLIPVPGAPKDPYAGEIGAARDRATGTLGFSNGKVGLNLTGTYIGKSYQDQTYLANINAARAKFNIGPPLDKNDLATPAQFYLDGQVTFTPARKYEFFIGVDNILDHDAPNLLSGTPSNNTGTDTAAAVYDVFGRRFYTGVRLRF